VEKDGSIILDVKKGATLYQFDRKTGEMEKLFLQQNLIDEAINRETS
jgi:hypothetical protein